MLPICCAAAGLLAAVLPGRAALPQWYQDAGLPAADTDGDGIPDAWERRTFSDPAVADSHLDRDGDGLTDLEEFAFGSDPRTFSTMGDGWSDLEKRGAGLDAAFRVVPTVSHAQWLAWLGWDAQTWQRLTATNTEGFAVAYSGFVYNTPPYSEEAGTVDFWLETRTDRPVWLTVGDALTTNSFPVRAGTGRVRLRAAYGGPVTLTLDPLPGTLAELPGATNGPWLCEMSVLPAHANTVVFTAGQTPPPPPGNPDSVNGLLLLAPPPAGPVRPLDTPAPSVTVQPLRMTDGTVFLGGSGWYCLCENDSCTWPDYAMIGCDTVSMAMNGVKGDTPLIPKEDALDTFFARQPCIECTVTQPVANAAYPFLHGRVIFRVRLCEAVGGVFGAEQNYWHEPGYHDSSLCGGIGCICDGGPRWDIGFSHSAVNTRNIFPYIGPDKTDLNPTEHCLGVVWSAGEKIDLFDLLDDCYLNMPNIDKLSFTSDNLTVNGNGELIFGENPKEFKPAISLVKLHYKPNDSEPGVIFDKLWVVVNRSDTQAKFDDWYAQNADISWTTNLPRPFASITINISNGTTNAVDPEPNPFGIGGRWHAPEAKNTFLHHDAKYEMRSKPTSGGHGHQAMYNIGGQLITAPIAAGTADLYAPFDSRGIPSSAKSHRDQDVYPFIRALQLDGNPVLPTDINRNLNRPCIYRGPNTDKYVERRPVLP
ncbi:MAG: binary toxin-like calcium binding domain-containing protein [Kiritimatiellia bacterium]|jgi:hypothetical protein